MPFPSYPGIVLAVLAVVCAPCAAATGGRSPESAGPPWRRASSFAYLLQNIEPERVAAFDCDLMIVDHSSDGSAGRVFTPQQVQQMQRGVRPKRLLAYMSIGEAEPYRFHVKDVARETIELHRRVIG